MLFCPSIQEERQERRRVKQSLGIVPPTDDSRKSRFDPPEEPVAGGVSLGLSPGG